jgi:hypothetical protein
MSERNLPQVVSINSAADMLQHFGPLDSQALAAGLTRNEFRDGMRALLHSNQSPRMFLLPQALHNDVFPQVDWITLITEELIRVHGWPGERVEHLTLCGDPWTVRIVDDLVPNRNDDIFLFTSVIPAP